MPKNNSTDKPTHSSNHKHASADKKSKKRSKHDVEPDDDSDDDFGRIDEPQKTRAHESSDDEAVAPAPKGGKKVKTDDDANKPPDSHEPSPPIDPTAEASNSVDARPMDADGAAPVPAPAPVSMQTAKSNQQKNKALLKQMRASTAPVYERPAREFQDPVVSLQGVIMKHWRFSVTSRKDGAVKNIPKWGAVVAVQKAGAASKNSMINPSNGDPTLRFVVPVKAVKDHSRTSDEKVKDERVVFPIARTVPLQFVVVEYGVQGKPYEQWLERVYQGARIDMNVEFKYTGDVEKRYKITGNIIGIPSVAVSTVKPYDRERAFVDMMVNDPRFNSTNADLLLSACNGVDNFVFAEDMPMDGNPSYPSPMDSVVAVCKERATSQRDDFVRAFAHIVDSFPESTTYETKSEYALHVDDLKTTLNKDPSVRMLELMKVVEKDNPCILVTQNRGRHLNAIVDPDMPLSGVPNRFVDFAGTAPDMGEVRVDENTGAYPVVSASYSTMLVSDAASVRDNLDKDDWMWRIIHPGAPPESVDNTVAPTASARVHTKMRISNIAACLSIRHGPTLFRMISRYVTDSRHVSGLTPSYTESGRISSWVDFHVGDMRHWIANAGIALDFDTVRKILVQKGYMSGMQEVNINKPVICVPLEYNLTKDVKKDASPATLHDRGFLNMTEMTGPDIASVSEIEAPDGLTPSFAIVFPDDKIASQVKEARDLSDLDDGDAMSVDQGVKLLSDIHTSDDKLADFVRAQNAVVYAYLPVSK